MLTSFPIINVASELSNFAWFRNIQEQPAQPNKMTIRCMSSTNDPEFHENVIFEQNSQGQLFAVYGEIFQYLGVWPDRIIKAEEATTAWFANRSVEIYLTYHPIIKMKP
ncbi:hypothetical protein A3J41_00225 [candidate division TM6 bacterium RIFCSPHIGHO2_12_FULL_38_8]|nr:MAG: hypothetical protein A3J41_00225 [candidate division TM6 bacterium RIFCSPHIGHO2_12_FULL_38_8]